MVATIQVPWPTALLVFLTVIFATAAFVELAIDEIQRYAKRAEESLLAKQTADAANQAKTDFLAKVSHELRTPLNGILGFSEFLMDKSIDPAQKQSAVTIHESSQHLLNLVNDLLDMSSIEAGRLELNIQAVEVRPLLKQLSELHRAAAVKKTIEIRLDIADDIPKSIMTDATRLRQVLNNLCHNAVKFADKGEVSITAGVARQGIEIRVRDQGPGIDPTQIPTLFERFKQPGIISGNPRSGAGLGLGIAK